MKLKSLKYARFEGEKAEWMLEGKPENGEYGQWCTFDDINLIVGANTSGKTNTLQVIRELADLLSGESELTALSYHTASYQLEFANHGQQIIYTLKFNQAKISDQKCHKVYNVTRSV